MSSIPRQARPFSARSTPHPLEHSAAARECRVVAVFSAAACRRALADSRKCPKIGALPGAAVLVPVGVQAGWRADPGPRADPAAQRAGGFGVWGCRSHLWLGWRCPGPLQLTVVDANEAPIANLHAPRRRDRVRLSTYHLRLPAPAIWPPRSIKTDPATQSSANQILHDMFDKFS
ncbi:hypothetical protein G7Z17_g5963 [Cylindrodendrum hubeiense]|uniref:Uncharacterized protein n=1 Tax=Cylindrodendrum hubeiense TaxID=595255 RepID=A0A9P5H5M3_9HYPO|nr:hypothetical protein G7Z17_g5963 [Cylindrodendrum hubeiense]